MRGLASDVVGALCARKKKKSQQRQRTNTLRRVLFRPLSLECALRGARRGTKIERQTTHRERESLAADKESDREGRLAILCVCVCVFAYAKPRLDARYERCARGTNNYQVVNSRERVDQTRTLDADTLHGSARAHVPLATNRGASASRRDKRGRPSPPRDPSSPFKKMNGFCVPWKKTQRRNQ
ncbi:hypothetical protein pneo_cds_202 [Pandoravirus neocaledonia]|uniref:Uncharacterized protein n=1 Tax=Pandoravirus neocaledonia TaxID=2107708 RepID=A0A2U7UBH5_9VIRU|nr:hypothetical protein pneo_cds_202 [Pandoravirus neocaledonia]AVK75809.1 hypothetical protein pneo_cds_202 [Pandoravirus neocaledonia]